MLKRHSQTLAVALALALVAATAARAQESTAPDAKPMVVVAFSGYEALISDLNFVGSLSGNPQLGAALNMMATMATGGQELKSLDKSKPWGALLFSKDTEIQGLGFVPLGDLEELKTLLEANGTDFEEADGLLTTTINNRNLCLKSEGGWLFASNEAESLAKLPEDPVAALGGLEKSYNLGVRVNIQSIPEMYRSMFVSLVETGLVGGAFQGPNESDEQFARREEVSKKAVEEVKRAANEIDAVQVGLAIDEEVPSIYLDIESTALPDSETARRIMLSKGLKTCFGGFVVPGAAVTYNGIARIEGLQITQLNMAIDTFRTNIHEELDDQELPEEVEAKSKKLVDDAFGVLTDTVTEGELDLGILALATEGRVTLLAGFHVADGAKVEELLKTLVEEASKEAPQLKDAVKFNAEEHGGVQLHTLTVPTAALGAPNLADMFGEELVLVIGTAEKAAYLSVGADSLDALKKAIDDSKEGGKDLPPSQLTVSVGAIAKLVAQYAPEDDVRSGAEMLVSKLADGKGKDRITITTTIPENGQKIRIEIEEDLLKLLGLLPAMAMGGRSSGG